MKGKKLKRILSLLLAVITAAAVPVTGALAAESDEPAYAPTDSYVINYAKTDLGSYEAQAPYIYASPHLGSMDIRDLSSGKMEGWITSQQVYNLINTTKLAQGGTGAYASIEAYCTDACVSASSGHSYQRINLEDSAYFDDTAAGRIRSIFLSSFPYIKDLSAIQSAVNQWLQQTGNEAAALDGLTGAEAISATQLAIWTIANGSDVELSRAYYYTDTYTAEELAGEVVYASDAYVNCMETSRDTTSNNITQLYNYLMALDGTEPAQLAVSNASFTGKTMTVTQQEDGKYTLTVTADVSVNIGQSDELILTAFAGDESKSVQLQPGQASYTLSFSDLSSVGTVKLEINGTQTAADVFLFDADGERTSSQSMVAYDSSTLPVHAETVVQPDRILNFYKTTSGSGDSGLIPLENIVFDIYRAGDMSDYAALPSAPTAGYAAENFALAATVTTGADGKASCNLSQLGFDDGIYLIVERANPAVVQPADPFYVSVPMTSASGDDWIYEIDIQPKNQVVAGPEISKDVTEIDNNEDTFAVGQTHTWIIRGDVPVDIAGGKEYLISDRLDWRLDYLGNVRVYAALSTDAAGEETVQLKSVEDYILAESSGTDSEQREIDCFTVSLTSAGMKKVAETMGSGAAADYEVRVYFDAAINSNASLAEDIPNSATLDYTNSVGFDFDAESDVPVVYTGGISILKYDAEDENKLLSGAQFSIARAATEEEVASGLSRKLSVGDEQLDVVFVEFYTDEQLSIKDDTVTTGGDGVALIYGLAYGDYYLVETKAPEGYNLLGRTVAVTVNAESHLSQYAVKVENSSSFKLPDAGGSGTIIFTAAGLLLIGAGMAVLLLYRRKAENR